MLKGFKEFLLRGNVIDLAVAVVIGAAFTAIVNALVSGVFNPAIGALFNSANLNDALDVVIPTTTGDRATIKFGVFLGAAIQFVIVALVVYFVLVLPINHLKKVAFARQQAADGATPAKMPPNEAELLTEIRDLLAAQADSRSGLSPSGRHAGATPEGE